jgi:aminoglycoside 6-adenylyltransferase
MGVVTVRWALGPSTMRSMDQASVLDDVVAWASADDNVRLVVLTGSVARRDGSVDELSDLDVELYVRATAPLLDTRDWYGRFGDVLVVEELDNPEWHPSRLVYYVDGKIDFMIANVDAARSGVGYDRAYRVLVDKDGLAGHLRDQPSRGSLPPSEDDLERCANWFYAAALMWAKMAVRDDPWKAKLREIDANEQLRRMIEWDHRSRYGWDYETWFLGAHFREWMDVDVAEALNECWADLTPERTIRALRASIRLFDRVARRTAGVLGHEPFDAGPVRAEIERVLALRARDLTRSSLQGT